MPISRPVRFRRPLALFSLLLPLGAIGLIAGGCQEARRDVAAIRVFKTPTCGCCSKWIEHLEAAGFTVESKDLPDLAQLKRENGVPETLVSCHTALVDGYAIEGHVPAADIERLLAERPDVAGLAVPEMPLGSPGMEHPDPSRHQPYDVLSFGAGGVKVFASHPAAPAS